MEIKNLTTTHFLKFLKSLRKYMSDEDLHANTFLCSLFYLQIIKFLFSRCLCMGTCDIRWALTGPCDYPLYRCRAGSSGKYAQPSQTTSTAPPSPLHPCPARCLLWLIKTCFPPIYGIRIAFKTFIFEPIDKQDISDQLEEKKSK